MADQFGEVKKATVDTANDVSTRLDSDLKALREDITRLTSSVSNLVSGQASTARTAVMGAVDDARGRVSDTASDARDRVTDAAGDLGSIIERNPLLAVTIAMIAGLFVGVLSRPRP